MRHQDTAKDSHAPGASLDDQERVCCHTDYTHCSASRIRTTNAQILARRERIFSPPRRSFTERTEEIGTRKNADERGFCRRRKVGELIARAFAAVFA